MAQRINPSIPLVKHYLSKSNKEFAFNSFMGNIGGRPCAFNQTQVRRNVAKETALMAYPIYEIAHGAALV
jgi:hypothetical protein